MGKILFINLKIMNNTIKIRDREIIEISEQDVPKYHLIGEGFGGSIGYCIYMGQKHAANFFQRVVAYRVTQSERAEIFNKALNNNPNVNETIRNTHYISVEFYENK